jgi:hypothetical protein
MKEKAQPGFISERRRHLAWSVGRRARSPRLQRYSHISIRLPAASKRAVLLLSLGAGGVSVLYLLAQNIRFAGAGLVIVVSGYASEIVGALRKRPAADV